MARNETRLMDKILEKNTKINYKFIEKCKNLLQIAMNNAEEAFFWILRSYHNALNLLLIILLLPNLKFLN